MDTVKVKFENETNPSSRFDMIRLEELLQRSVPDHNPKQLHKVEFYILLLITGGTGYHTIDFTDYKYEPGSLLTIRKDQLHKFFHSTSSTGFLFLFTDEFLVSYLGKEEAVKNTQLFNEWLSEPKVQLENADYQTILGIAKRIEDEYFQQMDNLSLSIIRSELHILLSKLSRIKSKQSNERKNRKYLTEFIAFQQLIEQNAFTTKRVADYAKKMNISTKTLNNITKEVINKTAKEFIDEICCVQIKRLLINTNLTVKEIAYTAGFQETTNFYKYFRRQLGLTPEQFRASF